MQLKIDVIDAFTDTLFKGNSAAVILVEDWLAEATMQAIAAENNLSETAFVKHVRVDYVEVRWFSPLSEIDFCGHATLASAFVLFAEQPDLNQITVFAEAVGEMSIRRKADGSIEMNFPNRKPNKVDKPPAALFDGLSIQPIEVWQNQQAYVAVMADEQQVHDVVQEIEAVKKLAPFDLVVTAQAEGSSKFDFVSRYFWPSNGGDEDPVTGSIHTALAPFWSERLGKNKLRAYQASQRGGVLHCKLEQERVYISGYAVPYLTGTITLPQSLG